MKYLLTCLLVGCLINPAWSVERDMTLVEFVQNLEKAEPWTQEKVESQLGVKFTDTTTTGVVTRYLAREALPSVKDLAIQYISLSVSAATNKAHSLRVHFDSDLSCLTLKQVEKLLPGGSDDFDDTNFVWFYTHERSWGELTFNFFYAGPKKESCLNIISITTNNPLK